MHHDAYSDKEINTDSCEKSWETMFITRYTFIKSEFCGQKVGYNFNTAYLDNPFIFILIHNNIIQLSPW